MSREEIKSLITTQEENLLIKQATPYAGLKIKHLLTTGNPARFNGWLLREPQLSLYNGQYVKIIRDGKFGFADVLDLRGIVPAIILKK